MKWLYALMDAEGGGAAMASEFRSGGRVGLCAGPGRAYLCFVVFQGFLCTFSRTGVLRVGSSERPRV